MSPLRRSTHIPLPEEAKRRQSVLDISAPTGSKHAGIVPVGLVGATGRLGRLIAHELLRIPEVRLTLLVRPESRQNVQDLEAAGATVILGDLAAHDPGVLDAFATEQHTIVSAVQGGRKILLGGQRALLAAAVHAGVRRFIPSTYSLDLFALPDGAIASTQIQKEFALLAEKERGEVEVTHVLIGAYLSASILFDYIKMITPETGTAHVWGDGHMATDFTTYADTARYTAAVAVDPRPVGRTFRARGDLLNFTQFVKTYEDATGQSLTVITEGTLADLDERIADLQSGGMGNFFTYLPLMYRRAQLHGWGTLGDVDNDRYPRIKPMTAANYLTRSAHARAGGPAPDSPNGDPS